VDVIARPYEERRARLAELVTPGPNWTVPAHRIGDGQALLDATRDRDLEGVMAKRLGSTYRPGMRSRDWRKVKNRRRTDVVIGGYTAGTGNRSKSFGALLVGRWADDGRLAFAGGVGTGFTQAVLDRLSAHLLELRIDECPFDPLPPREYRRGATWIAPQLTATIEITEFTNEGFVRQASFVELGR
jgi:bifunctional non-homologous end joining protein LigD